MKPMKMLLLLLLPMVLLVVACTPDGKPDPAVKVAVLKLGVGLAMDQAPAAVAPAYAASTAVLALAQDETVPLAQLDKFVDKQVQELNLQPTEKQALVDLVTIARNYIRQRLVELGDNPDQARVIVLEVIQIVHDAAAARLSAEASPDSRSSPAS